MCVVALISIASLDLSYTDIATILTCLCGGIFFGIFLLNKVFSLISPPASKTFSHSSELSREDAMIGFLKLVYADFGFVMLLCLFVMLAMIRTSFTVDSVSQPPPSQ